MKALEACQFVQRIDGLKIARNVLTLIDDEMEALEGLKAGFLEKMPWITAGATEFDEPERHDSLISAWDVQCVHRQGKQVWAGLQKGGRVSRTVIYQQGAGVAIFQGPVLQIRRPHPEVMDVVSSLRFFEYALVKCYLGLWRGQYHCPI